MPWSATARCARTSPAPSGRRAPAARATGASDWRTPAGRSPSSRAWSAPARARRSLLHRLVVRGRRFAAVGDRFEDGGDLRLHGRALLGRLQHLEHGRRCLALRDEAVAGADALLGRLLRLLRKALATSFSFGVLAESASLACWRRRATSASARCLLTAGSGWFCAESCRRLAKLLAVPVGELALHHVPGGKLSKLCIELLRAGIDGGLRHGRCRGRGGRRRQPAKRMSPVRRRSAPARLPSRSARRDCRACRYARRTSRRRRAAPRARARRRRGGCPSGRRCHRILVRRGYGPARTRVGPVPRPVRHAGQVEARDPVASWGAARAAGAGSACCWKGNTAGAGRQSANPGRQIRSVGLR